MNLQYSYYKLKCSSCERKILVEINRFGTNHDASVHVVCADCIKFTEDSDFAKDKPKAFEDISNWIKE